MRDLLLRNDPATEQMVGRLATVAAAQHNDYWLSDFVRAPNTTATQALVSAIKHNQSGSAEEAASEAKVALGGFRRIGNRAGAARSQFELVYALQRQSLADRCRTEVVSLRRLIAGRRYSWLSVEAELEMASCDGMLANFDAALQHAKKAADLAISANYPVLHLRAMGFAASIEAAAGRGAEAWAADVTGLEKFWQQANPADRGYQFYSDLELEAEAKSHFSLAALLQREALIFAEESNRTDIQAIGHFRLGTLYRVLEENEGAQGEFASSHELFSRLSNTGSTELYKQYCDVLLATIDLTQGSDNSANRALSKVDSLVMNSTNFSLQLAYWRAAAELADKLGDAREQQYLVKALNVAKGALKSLRTEQERWDWTVQIRDLERRLFYLSVARSNNAYQSFAAWQEYGITQLAGDLSRSAKAHDESRPAQLLRQALDLHKSTLISYAVLPQHLLLWMADDRGIKYFDIQMSESKLDALVRHFYQLCSDPSTDQQKIKAVGRRLYELLLGPVHSRLDHSRTLFIQPDGILGLIPWGALSGPDGKYLLETETIVSTEGLMPQQPHKKMGRSEVLAVYPGAVSFHGRKYLPLPDAEIEMATLPRKALILRGVNAVKPRVLRSLSMADILYFAGHAVSDEHGGKLILHQQKGAASLTAADITRLDLSHLRIAVLAACDTGYIGTGPGDPNALPHAFLNAGATLVVASDWAVDSSSTRDLMIHLLKSGANIRVKNLRDAELGVKNRLSNSHPYYWASFQLYGEAQDD